jgi:hypothetical protein
LLKNPGARFQPALKEKRTQTQIIHKILGAPTRNPDDPSLGKKPLDQLETINRKDRPVLSVLGVEVGEAMFSIIYRYDNAEETRNLGHFCKIDFSGHCTSEKEDPIAITT